MRFQSLGKKAAVVRDTHDGKKSIEKVVVLGAGTMGARIAAHVANAGVWCALLDIAPPELTPEEKSAG